MSSLWIHPAALLFAGAALLVLLPQRLRKIWLLLVPTLVFARVLCLDEGIFGQVRFGDGTLTFGRVDRLSQVFAHIMALMVILGTLYGLHVRRVVEHVAAWVYAAGSIGAIHAGDWLTLFLFWEVMALSSVFLIWFRGRQQSLPAGYRYLLVHMAGGLFLLMGILLHYRATGSLEFVALPVDQPTAAVWCVMMGFILNAAVPPLHAWLPDAYGEGTFNGSVFLCAFTTKTAVYALCRGLPGLDILVPLGVVMALYGVVYAVLENDSRRLLAYHIISQVGYMVAAVGLGDAGTPVGQLAINGACAHAFAHILYKGLLFMGCGAVLHQTGESRFNRLGGLYQRMPWTFLFTLVGGLSISAFPFFSGFVSKSMIVAAGFESHQLWVGFLLMLASAGTFLHTGLKVPYFIWFGRNNCASEVWQRAKDPVWNMNAAMAATAALCVCIGCYTPYLYGLLPFPVDYHPYTAYHVSETLQVLGFTAVGFFLLLGKLIPEAKISLDFDLLYRRAGSGVVWLARHPIQWVDTAMGEIYRVAGLAPVRMAARAVGIFDQKVIDGLVDGVAGAIGSLGARLRALQRGSVQENLIVALVGAAVIGAAVILWMVN